MRPITHMLAELPNLAAEVFLTWTTPNPAPKADRTIRSVPGSRPPTRLDVWDALRPDQKGDLRLLHGWCITIDEVSDGELAPIPEQTPTWNGVARYLTETWPWWRTHELADDCTHEISAVHGRLRTLARTPRTPHYVCSTCGGRAHPQPGGQWMRCDEGHEQSGIGAIRDQFRRLRPMTSQAMEEHYGDTIGLNAATIASWARRGWLQEAGRVLIRHKWRPTYHPWDVIQVLYRHDTAAAVAERSA